MDNKMLRDIVAAYGPSGREEIVSSVIAAYVKPYCDEVYNDALGNLIAVKRGTSGKKIMLSAHMDQIGLIAVAIDERGFIRVANVGGVSPIVTLCREVAFENGVHGVVYCDTKDTSSKDATIQKLFIDIGAKSREEAEKKVAIGDVAVYVTNFVEMGERAASGAMDNRVCCYAIAEAMKEMKSEHDVYAVFTVQEEVGCRGAGAAAYAIQPDFAVNLDVTSMGDIPECQMMEVSLGGGCTVKVLDGSVVVAPIVFEYMEKCAAAAGVKTQREVLRSGGTDTGIIQRTSGGVYAGCISIPTRYLHSPVETVDYNDVDAAVKLTRACAEGKELPHR